MAHDPIDLDALVDTLEREKAEGKPLGAAEPLPPAETAPAAVPPETPRLEWETAAPAAEPVSVETVVEPEETMDAAYEVPPLRFEETEAPPSRRQLRRQRRKERRRREPEVAMEDWADWGLDPLGTHDRTETFSHSVTPESPSMPAISAEKPVSCAEAPAAEPPVAAEPETPDMPAAETPAAAEPDSFDTADAFPPVRAKEPSVTSFLLR